MAYKRLRMFQREVFVSNSALPLETHLGMLILRHITLIWFSLLLQKNPLVHGTAVLLARNVASVFLLESGILFTHGHSALINMDADLMDKVAIRVEQGGEKMAPPESRVLIIMTGIN